MMSPAGAITLQSNVIQFPSKAKPKEVCATPSDGDGSWCERNRAVLTARYTRLAGLMNSKLLNELQYNRAARLYNSDAVSHNTDCPSYRVPMLPISRPTGI